MIPMRRAFLSLLTLSLMVGGFALLQAQAPFSGTPQLTDSLARLDQLGTVLMIAAHPDDERTSLLALFARGRHMRAAYLSATRGEGGQNLIGSDLGPELGVIRTQELLAARRIDGAEQFFTRAIDFGFSKSAPETLAKWGHDRILSDMVWVIRRYRPDVVILVFSGTPADGHGHHQVSSMLGREAFAAAGDPARFPEQLQYAAAWKPRRLVRAGWFNERGGGGAASAGQAETGAFDPMLGYSYEELATLSRSMHHSQGTGAMRRVGPSTTSFSLLAGDPAKADIFEGIDTSWNRLPGGAAVGPLIAEAIRAFDPAHPEKALPALAKARPLIAAIRDPLAAVKLAELDEAMAGCAGLWVEAQARQPEAAPGTRVGIATTVLNRSAAEVAFESASMEGLWNADLPARPATLTNNQPVTIEFTGEIPAAQPYSQPYWLVKPPSDGAYTVDDQRLIGLADTPPVAQVRVRLRIAGAPVELVRPIHYRYAERSEGERVRPFVVAPAVAVVLPDSVAVFPSASARKIHVAVKARVPNAAGELRLATPAGWKADPPSRSFRVAAAGEQQELEFDVTPAAGNALASLHAVATVAGRETSAGVEVLSYPHIPPQTLFPPAEMKLVRADIKVTAKRVGYIMGAGDDMPDAMRQMGVEVALLGPSDLDQGDLSRFDAIVAGVRAYNVRADLRANQPRLLEYVRNGGTYLVQYNTGDNALNMGPYPFTVPPGTRWRVTVEDAPVAFPDPASPLLASPNRITPADFEGWVQERGLYFSTQWDPRYQTVMASADPGEAPLAGGELWTRYGKGIYIFTCYAWFRQLPAGVPGAFRLFANLLSAK
jgi:LmbE family N-acetylglucosaminyl deacetylase